MYEFILFDLDGTLTDSKEGILNSIRSALKKMEQPIPPEKALLSFIGPPLGDSFSRVTGFSGEQTREAIRLFRERYDTIGKFENAAAPGIADMFRRLTERGRVLALASSKPVIQCADICDHFGFTPYLREIVGSPPEGRDWNKAEVIQEAMRRLGLDAADRPRTLMVGDRRYDVEGARRNGIDCVGVEFFGYAAPGELKTAGAVAVVQTVDALEKFIMDA